MKQDSPVPGLETEPDDPAEVRRKARGAIRAPATALLLVGLLGTAANLFQVIWLLSAEQELATLKIPIGRDHINFQVLQPNPSRLTLVFGLIPVAVNVVITAGAVCMLRLRGYALALIGCAVALVNCGLCVSLSLAVWFLSYPVGIWSFLALRRPDVREAFK